MDSSKNLIETIVAGDKNSFKLLIEQYQKLVSHIVFRMIHKESDREDLCQEIFIKVYQNLTHFKFEAKLSTWIARIAYNTCINYLEKKKVALYEDLIPEDHTIESYTGNYISPENLAVDKNLSDLLQLEINMLPVQYRTILTLFHLDELSYTEISEIMDLPSGTVKSYLFRARKLLKQRLTEKFQQEELWQ